MTPLALLCFALCAPQAPVEVTFSGTVASSGNTLSTPALAGAAVGDAVEYSFTVDTPGNLGGAGQFDIYPVQASSLSLEVGAAMLTGGSSAAGCFFFDRPAGGTGDILNCSFNLSAGVALAFTLNDPTSLAWNSVDIQLADGTYPASTFPLNVFELTDSGGSLLADLQSVEIHTITPPIGTAYCGPAPVNSTGAAAELTAEGSQSVADNDVTLEASFLPMASFGFFITSRAQGLVMNPGGSVGNLCLGGAIGRYVGPGQIQNAGTTGEISLVLDLGVMPQPTGAVSVLSGDTWNFQAWYRDAVGGVPGSNLTNGFEVTFQ